MGAPKADRSGLRLFGLVLWRGGMALAGAGALYYAAWRFIRGLAWPGAVKVGVSLALAGGALVLVSLILERIRDAAREENLED